MHGLAHSIEAMRTFVPKLKIMQLIIKPQRSGRPKQIAVAVSSRKDEGEATAIRFAPEWTRSVTPRAACRAGDDLKRKSRPIKIKSQRGCTDLRFHRSELQHIR